MPYANSQSTEAIASRRKAAKASYERHRLKIIARASAWNKKNRAKVNARAKNYRRTKISREKVLWWNDRNRAKAQGIEFSLSIDDIIVPDVCPILGIKLEIAFDHAKDGSPSIDRIDPLKGYVRGNVQIISHKANTIKSNATLAEMRLLLAHMEAYHAARNSGK